MECKMVRLDARREVPVVKESDGKGKEKIGD